MTIQQLIPRRFFCLQKFRDFGTLRFRVSGFWSPKVLALASLSNSRLLNFQPLSSWAHNTAVTNQGRDFKISALRFSGLRYPGVHEAVTPSLLSLQSPTFKISISLPSGPIVQLSPLTTVAHGTFRRVHITLGDVIVSHHSRFSSRPTGTWYTPMCPRPFQVKSNDYTSLRSTTQILLAFQGTHTNFPIPYPSPPPY
jgi:hypothetical protein